MMTRGLPDDDGALTPDGVERGARGERARRRARARARARAQRPDAFAFARALAGRGRGGAGARRRRAERACGPARRSRSARRAPTVLTPHAGELARLLELDSAEIERERLRHVRAAAERSGAVVVLKGDDTLIADPDGRVAVSPGGSPALATAGTGDVLTGVIAAMLAQGLDAFAAAAAGVWLHAQAGRQAASRAGRGRGRDRLGRDRRAAGRARGAAAAAGGRCTMADGDAPSVAGRREHAQGAGAGERGGDRAQLRAPAHAAARRRARCARSSRLTATATAPCRAPGRRSPAARAGWRWRRATRRASCARPACATCAMLVMGALSAVELERGARGGRRRGRVERGLPAARSPRRAADAFTSSSTPAWAGSARATRRGLARGARPRSATPGVQPGGRDDAFRHRGRARRRRLLRRASWPRSRAGRSAVSEQHPEHPRARRQQRRDAARRRRRTSTWSRCGIAIYGMDPFGSDPAARALEPALELSSYVAEVKLVPRGGERRLRTPVRGRRRHLHRRAADRLRRRLAARAVQQRRRAHRRAPPPAGRHGQHGQHHRRPRAARPSVERLRGERAILIGIQGSERITAEEVARRLDTINYEVTCALTPRVPRVYHRDGVPLDAERASARPERRTPRRHERRAWRRPRRAGGHAGVAGRRRGARPRCSDARPRDLDIVVDGDPARGRARGRARGAGAPRASRSRRSSAPGGWSRATAPGRSTSSRCAAARSRPTSRCATSPSTRSPSRSPAGSRSIPSAGSPTCAPGACGWPRRAAFARGPAARAAPGAPRASSSTSSSTPQTLRAARRARAAACARVSAERVFAELRRIVASPRGAPGPRADGRARAPPPSCCPSSRRCAACEQSRFHHLDVHGHTLEVLDRDGRAHDRRDDPSSEPAAVLGEQRRARSTRCSPSRSRTS